MESDGVDRRHPDAAGNHVTDLLEAAQKRVERLDHLLGALVEELPLLRESELLLASLDEQDFQLLLEGTHLLAHSALGHTVDLGRLGETLGLSQVTEDAEALDLHPLSLRQIPQMQQGFEKEN